MSNRRSFANRLRTLNRRVVPLTTDSEIIDETIRVISHILGETARVTIMTRCVIDITSGPLAHITGLSANRKTVIDRVCEYFRLEGLTVDYQNNFFAFRWD